jgi:hypothetical protein
MLKKPKNPITLMEVVAWGIAAGFIYMYYLIYTGQY